jgi:hypothetical protein
MIFKRLKDAKIFIEQLRLYVTCRVVRRSQYVLQHRSHLQRTRFLHHNGTNCWKLRHTQYSISHRMMVIGATDKLSCIEAYDDSV